MTPSAEIIVLLYGQPELERRCLEAVAAHTDLTRHKLTVIDNWQRDANLSHVWNQAIARSDREFVCLLNSDAVVEAQWLERMLQVAGDEAADAVGPKSDRAGAMSQKGPTGPGVTPTDQLSGFCLLLRRSSVIAAGGFREDFTFYGQESNLMLRLRRKFVANPVWVLHASGASVRAVQRQQEEVWLRNEFWPRQLSFNWNLRIAILGYGPGMPGPLWAGIDDAVKEFARERCTVKHFSLATVTADELKDWKPGAVIVCSGMPQMMRGVEALKGVTCPRGFWFNDLRTAAEYQAGRLAPYRINRAFLCFKHTDEYSWDAWSQLLGSAGVTYMPQGCRIHPELAPLELRGKTLFIGDLENQRFHSGRREVVAALGATHINFKEGTSARDDIYRKTREIYRQYEFILSMSPGANGYTSQRTYDILAFGGLALVKRFPGCDDLFEHRKHVLFWTKIDEARALIEEYSAKPDECERIRKRGWRLSQARHTGMRRIMNIASALTTANRGFWGSLS